jgi:glycosyltransferase involved in cell wall biosynthesis
MRVEFVSPYDHNPKTGIGRYVHTLVGHLSNSIDATICRPRFLPLTNQISPLRNLPVSIEGHLPGSIVHFPQIMGCAMMLYRPYHPSVATVHDLGFLELPEEREMIDPIARRLLRLSLAGLKRVDLIVTDSEFTHQGVIKHLGVSEECVVTIYPGIDHTLFRPIPNARNLLIERQPHLAAIAEAPWLLYVGSELPRKNVGTLLQAIASVREKLPDIRLLKVGSAGGERFRRDTMREIDRLGLGDHILFFEDVAEEELPLFYNAADVFVTASKLEGFGFPVLEAMACGTPVVCSRAGSLPEIVGACALQFDSDDIVGFGKGILAFIRNDHFANELRQKGFINVCRFTLEYSSEKMCELYGRLL